MNEEFDVEDHNFWGAMAFVAFVGVLLCLALVYVR